MGCECWCPVFGGIRSRLRSAGLPSVGAVFAALPLLKTRLAMVVRSETSDRLEGIQLSPEPPPSPAGSPSVPHDGDGRQLKDALKKGGKRIFPLYDNFSKTVKRHREKSREREKSRDIVRQREKLRLQEEESAANVQNSANGGSDSATKLQADEEERGRDKTKEKRRFYLRDKSRDKKKNKDKAKEKNEKSAVEEDVTDIRRQRLTVETCDSSRPSSSYSSRDDSAIYGAVEMLSVPSGAAARDPRSSAASLSRSGSGSSAQSATQRSAASLPAPASSSASTAPVTAGRPASAVVGSASATAAPRTLPSDPSPLQNRLTCPPDWAEYGAVYGAVDGRGELYESPLGRYGAGSARYFTLEQTESRRTPEHDYETFENVLGETAAVGASTSQASSGQPPPVPPSPDKPPPVPPSIEKSPQVPPSIEKPPPVPPSPEKSPSAQPSSPPPLPSPSPSLQPPPRPPAPGQSSSGSVTSRSSSPGPLPPRLVPPAQPATGRISANPVPPRKGSLGSATSNETTTGQTAAKQTSFERASSLKVISGKLSSGNVFHEPESSKVGSHQVKRPTAEQVSPPPVSPNADQETAQRAVIDKAAEKIEKPPATDKPEPTAAKADSAPPSLTSPAPHDSPKVQEEITRPDVPTDASPAAPLPGGCDAPDAAAATDVAASASAQQSPAPPLPNQPQTVNTAQADRIDTPPSAKRSETPVSVSATRHSSGETASASDSSDKVKTSRRFLSFPSRGSGKATTKRSFLSSLLRPDGASPEPVLDGRSSPSDVNKTKSLPAKYREFFRDRKSARAERTESASPVPSDKNLIGKRVSSATSVTSAASDASANSAAKDAAREAKRADGEVVEIELPGVFGRNQMRASLRITLKGKGAERGAGSADGKENRGSAGMAAGEEGAMVASRALQELVRSRASQGKPLTKRDEQRLSVAIAPETVSALTSKFNALIQASTSAENSPSPTGAKTFNLGSITVDKAGNVAKPKAASFRRSDAARLSARRRVAARHAAAQAQQPESTLVSRASAALSRRATSPSPSRVSGAHSGPSSFRQTKPAAVEGEKTSTDANNEGKGAGKTATKVSAVKTTAKAVVKPTGKPVVKAASFRKTKPGGGFCRDATRLSGRRRVADVSGRQLGWTSAVRAEQKKNAPVKTEVIAEDKPAARGSTGLSKKSETASVQSLAKKEKFTQGKTADAPPKRETAAVSDLVPKNNNEEITLRRRTNTLGSVDKKHNSLTSSRTYASPTKRSETVSVNKESSTQKKSDVSVGHKTQDTSNEPKKVDSSDQKKTLCTTDQKKPATKKPVREKTDVTKIFDRELRKITNTGTVAKASELWLKMAQSNSSTTPGRNTKLTSSDRVHGSAASVSKLRSQLSFGEKTDLTTRDKADTLRSSVPDGRVATDISVLRRSLTLGKTEKIEASQLPEKEAVKAASLADEKGGKRESNSAARELTESKKREKEMSKDTKNEKEPTKEQPTTKLSDSPKQHGKNAKEDKTKANVKDSDKETSSDKASFVPKQPADKVSKLMSSLTKSSPSVKTKDEPKISMAVDNNLYGTAYVTSCQSKRSFDNKLYGETFTPIQTSIHKYVTVATQGQKLSQTAAAAQKAGHPPVGKSLSLRSLPGNRLEGRVKDVIHRFEAPATSTSAHSALSQREAALKSATLPSRMPTVLLPLGRGTTSRLSCMPAFYESIWEGQREYKPNESFLWHGSSQLTSCGESGSAGSSFSDRDTASTLSDASSLAEEEAAARARSSLLRRLAARGPPAAAPAPAPAMAAADYEPGGSSSSGTVTYENGSDPGYERISGESCAGYEQIGSRYERVGGAPPSETTSAGYETLAPPSETSTLCYDDCVVPARLAVVSEHQKESLNYLETGYEDISGGWLGRALAEGAAGKPTPLQPFDEEAEETDDEDDGPQTVNSYQLTDFGVDQVAAPAPQQMSLPSTPRDRMPSDRDTGGEWTDIDADGEQEASDDTEASADSPMVVTRPHFVRVRSRRSRRFSKTRAGRRSWSQSSKQDPRPKEGPWRHTTMNANAVDGAECQLIMLNFSLRMPENLPRPLPPPRPPKLVSSASSRSFDGHPRKLLATAALSPEIYMTAADAVQSAPATATTTLSAPAPATATDTTTTQAKENGTVAVGRAGASVVRRNTKPKPPPLPPKPVLTRKQTGRRVTIAGVPSAPVPVVLPTPSGTPPLSLASDISTASESDTVSETSTLLAPESTSGQEPGVSEERDTVERLADSPLNDSGVGSEAGSDPPGSVHSWLYSSRAPSRVAPPPPLTTSASCDRVSPAPPPLPPSGPSRRHSAALPPDRGPVPELPPRRPSDRRHSLVSGHLPLEPGPEPPPRPSSAQARDVTPTPCPLRAGSSNSSLTSSLDSSSRTVTPRKLRLPDPPPEEDSVYVVSATSVIYIGNESSHDPGDYDAPYERNYYNAARPRAVTDNSAVLKHTCHEENGELQELSVWMDNEGGDTDDEWLDDGHLYEALDSHYEPVGAVPEAVDSDDDVVEEEDKELGDEELDQDNAEPSNGMQKIAEGMRRLQKNWNSTKSDIRSGISRIRKKSTSAPEQTITVPVSVVIKPTKWWMKNRHRKKKSISGTAGATGDSSTFYLDLVIQPGQAEEAAAAATGAAEEEGDIRSESDPGSNRSSVRRSDTDSLSSLQQADSRVRLPSTQSSSSRESAGASAAHASSPGFARSLSTHSQPSPRTLSAFRHAASLESSSPPPLPPAVRVPRHPLPDGAEPGRPPPPRLERSSAICPEPPPPAPPAAPAPPPPPAASSHDNSEYMLSADPAAAASAAAAAAAAEEEQYTSLLDKEPLYQVYLQNRCYQESVSVSSEDDYETIRESSPAVGVDAECSSDPPPPPPPARRRMPSRPSAIELLSAPAEGQRSLWCQLPEVISSGVLDSLSSEQKRLQEALFEVISSEASYQKSLSVLVRHFKEEPTLCEFQSPDCVINKADYQALFSNADKVRQCSEAFLTGLERTWQENVMLHGLCEVIQTHAATDFQAYKHYCANQIIQDRKLKELRDKNPAFVEVLKRLEASPQCQSLSLHSFLMLPMQRVTRLPLLVSAILVKLEPGHPEYNSCQQAYQTLTQLVKDCNEEARRNERLEELVSISRQLVFKDIKSFPLVTKSRWLIKKGELVRTIYKADDSKLTFGRKQTRQQTVHVFLFNDLLLISKRKGDDSYTVLDYCLRNMVQLTENAEDRAEKFLLTLLNNHEGKTVEMLFCCPVESERVRWLEAVMPKPQRTDTETVYESWDCPQVQAMHPYTAQQPDELTLQIGDVMKVHRKVPDGWYQGMRLMDSATGWFPSNRCQEIMSEHVRARHLRQRYEVLRITGDFLRQERERKLRAEKEAGRGGSPPSERAAAV
ncbi:pneumococcal serine-rich repeat protein-like isoform X2 [Amphibalanus amphitrite]|uniref:pneumococcal serine-rich repeat protein-like isoform X2 n=1 Tax=Amphibalanus amphitrite TaxID=1232801 RepID=UPI001C909C90|nr:pneumococcal serine-rich repeat protein-like isoform X2 [Amphibalanus amphitrite]